MKKTLLIIIFTLFIAVFGFAGTTRETDISIYNEVTAAFETGFYPGAVEKANLLEIEYPESVLLLPALIQKGESLIYLNRYDEARQTLETAISRMHTGSEDFSRCYFLLGKTCYLQKEYVLALENFHNACTVSATEKDKSYYPLSVIYSGKIFYQLEKYENALLHYEYVLSHGNEYSVKDFEEAFLRICVCYNRTGKPEKTIEVFKNVPSSSVSFEVYYSTELSVAEAYEMMGNKEAALQTYDEIIKLASDHIAVFAMKKAYLLGENVADSLGKFSDRPELVKEFWLRLGIDEYNSKDFLKAQIYLDYAGENPVAFVYQQKIALETGTPAGEVYENLQKKLELAQSSEIAGVKDSYYALMLQCVVMQKDWEKAESLFTNIENPDVRAVTNMASALYALEKFEESATLLQQHAQNTELLASALVRAGKNAEGIEVYKNLLSVSSKGCLEYSKALFKAGVYKNALENAEKSELPEGLYIAGLCSINLKNWTLAKNYFVEYNKLQSNKLDFIPLSLFYKGYAEYCLEQYKDAYASFIRYANEAGSQKKMNAKKPAILIRNAYEYAAKSALQLGEYKNASAQAQNVIKTSRTTEEKQTAVIFCAEIYSDYGSYDQAVAILSPYTKEKGEFAIQTLAQTASIYVKQGKIQDADKIYIQIYTNNPNSAYAEEAMYRSGEIYYTSENYGDAENRLNKYIYKYPNGKFAEAALFYCGDCCVRLGELEKSIMMNKTLLKKYNESIYLYGTYKNLLTAYYETASYSDALETARYLVANFQTQAASDGIGTKLKELEKIVSGTDVRVAETYSRYENLGKTATKEGRETGTKLVQLYAENDDTKREAFNLATELLALQKDSSEKYSAALNAEFIADYSRANNENQKAAEMYLLAAEYYREGSNADEKAASALYGAAEAFVACGLTADAKETAGLLIKLYPESKQAKNVKRLVK